MLKPEPIEVKAILHKKDIDVLPSVDVDPLIITKPLMEKTIEAIKQQMEAVDKTRNYSIIIKSQVSVYYNDDNLENIETNEK